MSKKCCPDDVVTWSSIRTFFVEIVVAGLILTGVVLFCRSVVGMIQMNSCQKMFRAALDADSIRYNNDNIRLAQTYFEPRSTLFPECSEVLEGK
jgi:hypothetical protein